MTNKILDIIKLNKETSMTLDSDKKVYFITHKLANVKKKDTNIDTTAIERVIFQILIDSGVANKHICVDTFSITFDKDTDVAYTLKSGIPVKFYLKPIEFVTYKNQKILDGYANISLYTNNQ